MGNSSRIGRPAQPYRSLPATRLSGRESGSAGLARDSDLGGRLSRLACSISNTQIDILTIIDGQSQLEATVPWEVESESALRLDRLRMHIKARRLDAAIVSSPAALTYLTALGLQSLERPAALVVHAAGPARLVVPELEMERASSEMAAPLELTPWSDGADPWAAVASAIGAAESIGVERDSLSIGALEALERALGRRCDGNVSAALAELRIEKSPTEHALLRRAAAVVDACLGEAVGALQIGRSEQEIANDVRGRSARYGGDPFSTYAVVLSGPMAAQPHARPGGRTLRIGDMVIVDVATRVDGYWADATRTYAVGNPGNNAIAAYDAVRRAQAAALSIIAPGVACGEVDAAARNTIARAGYGDRFLHRTGHGIGLEVHEPPWLVAGADTRLREGTALAVEPGIYVNGAFGVRLEDDVIVTESGCETLTHPSDGLIDCLTGRMVGERD